MIAFKDSFESEEDKIKKALKNLMKAVEEVGTDPLLEEVEPSTYLDTDLSEIIDILYQSLFTDNNSAVNLIITKNINNSLDLTIENLK
jgi:hypothetical protein